jgi:hypothetical protein
LATGGGFARRQLYTDTEEVLLNAVRPILLNDIEDMVSRPDLADRAITDLDEPGGRPPVRSHCTLIDANRWTEREQPSRRACRR